MKRVISFLMAVAMLLCLAGCGSSTGESTSAESTAALQTEAQTENESQAATVRLVTMKAYNTEGSISSYTDSTDDIFGNVYSSYMCTYNHNSSYIYRIDETYKTFSGTFFIRSTDSNDKGDVEIYGDDILLYSVTVHGGEDPTSFSIDITGVRDLTLAMDSYDGLYLGDPILTP